MTQDQQCPLCGATASCLVRAGGYSAADHRYNCPQCGVFEIDAATREFLGTQDDQTRRTLAHQAKSAPAGMMYRLRAPTDAERQSQKPRPLVISELLGRDDVQ